MKEIVKQNITNQASKLSILDILMTNFCNYSFQRETHKIRDIIATSRYRG